MSFKSCKICEGRLNAITLHTNMAFECNQCGKKYKPEKKDSLRFEQNFKTENDNISIYKKFIRNAPYDYTTTKQYKQCPTCKNEITAEIAIGKSKKYINVCKCGNIF